MGFLRELFGPSREEVWQALSNQIGANYLDGGFWNTPKVQVRHGDWLLTLDTFTVSTGKSSVTYTRLRSPFVNRDGFRFAVYRAGLFTELGKVLFGTQDFAFPDDALFDKQFVIQSNARDRILHLLRNQEIRRRIAAQPQLYFALRDATGNWGQNFPDGVDELYFQVHGIIKNLDHLRWLFELFAETMNLLGHLDSGHRDDFEQFISDLVGPGGTVNQDQAILWDGNLVRRKAARGLGRLGDQRAVTPLVSTLVDSDPELRALSAEALGRLKHPGSALHLIPLLGDREFAAGKPVAAAAEEALRALDHSAWVNAFHGALTGNPEGLAACEGPERVRFVRALRPLLAGSDVALVLHAARALAEMGAEEAVPDLEKAARRVRREHPQAFEALDTYAETLKRHQALPRAADAPALRAADLPLPADGAAPDAADLPRPSGPATP